MSRHPEAIGPTFVFDEPDLGQGVVLTTEPQVLAALPMLGLVPQDRTWLSATVGWEATAGIPVVVLFIDRQVNGTSTQAYSIQDSREAGFDKWGDSSLNHVDTGQCETVVYRLLASLAYNQSTGQPYGQATVHGASLTGTLYSW